MARLLGDAKERTKDGLESDNDLNERVEAETIPKLAVKLGASPLIEKVRTLSKDLESAEEDLRRRGFSCDDDDISIIRWNAPRSLRKALDDAKRSARRERDAELTKYDRAILSVRAAETAVEAKKTVQELL